MQNRKEQKKKAITSVPLTHTELKGANCIGTLNETLFFFVLFLHSMTLTVLFIRCHVILCDTPPLCLKERLLLSLLPAHIARVMKAEIIQRLQGPNFGRTESTNNFHNLYVQRHTNVR